MVIEVYVEKMQFSSNVKRGVLKLGDKQESYRLSVQFYLQPPTENISLMEFESFACDRLKLLKAVENLGVSYVKGDASYQDKLESELRHLKFPYRALTEDDYDARRKDHISHFILRLAYCQSEELKRWFIQQEMDLFRYRFNQLSHSLVEKFLQYANLGYDIICTQIFHYIHTEFGTHSDISNAVQSTLVILKGEDNVLNSQLEELMLCVFVTDKVDKEGGRINRVAGNADVSEI
ncbi:hypothetical protein E2320_019462 [Naja naja]|nr:hypothetical protein E2320_019462 [Naja naja]